MSVDDPAVATVSSKGQITIPSEFREAFELEQGTKLLVVPTDHGLVLQKIDLPSVADFQSRVAERAAETDLTIDDVTRLVHEARAADK